MGGLFLDVYIVFLLRVFWRLGNLLRSRKWGKVTANVLGSHLIQLQCIKVEVDYEYMVDGEKLAATFAKPFIDTASAKVYAGRFGRGRAFTIRIKPGNPEVSVADGSVENWWKY